MTIHTPIRPAVATLASLLCAALLAACGGGGADSPTADAAVPPTVAQPSQGEATVVFVTTPTTAPLPTTSTTTLPPTTTTTTTTTTQPPTTTSTSTTTTPTTTLPPTTTTTPPPIDCSFGADALFAAGEFTLSDAAEQTLRSLLDGVSDIRSIRIEGHTDHRGSDADNLQLSQQRADATARVFIAAGVDSALVVAVGLGESHAAQGIPTDAQMADERRVEVAIDAVVPTNFVCPTA